MAQPSTEPIDGATLIQEVAADPAAPLDAFMRRDPFTLSRDDKLHMIQTERARRALWLVKSKRGEKPAETPKEPVDDTDEDDTAEAEVA